MSASRELIRCPNCQEENSPYRASCWICAASLEGLSPETGEGSVVPAEPHFLSASIFRTIAVLLVILGTIILAPGMGILLACALCAPFVRTVLVARRRAERGYEDAFPTTVSLFLGSMGVTFVILVTVGVTAFVTFVLACISGDSTPEGFWTAFVVLFLALLVPPCWVFWKWVRRRWKRDIGDMRK